MDWDKNDWYTAALIGLLLVAGLVIGINGLEFLSKNEIEEVRWKSGDMPNDSNSTSFLDPYSSSQIESNMIKGVNID